MSKGYGAVQRHVLARLAENPADPAADHDAPPYHQSWTSLHDLRTGTRYHEESVRRAVSKLAPAGIVETRLLRPVHWHGTADPNRPGARRRPSPPKGWGPYARLLWCYPTRTRGNAATGTAA